MAVADMIFDGGHDGRDGGGLFDGNDGRDGGGLFDGRDGGFDGGRDGGFDGGRDGGGFFDGGW